MLGSLRGSTTGSEEAMPNDHPVSSQDAREYAPQWRSALEELAQNEPDWDALSDGRAVGDDLAEFQRGYYDAHDGGVWVGLPPDPDMAYDAGWIAGQIASGRRFCVDCGETFVPATDRQRRCRYCTVADDFT